MALGAGRGTAVLIGDCHVAEVAEAGTAGARPYTVDPERARALWATSEDRVGERF